MIERIARDVTNARAARRGSVRGSRADRSARAAVHGIGREHDARTAALHHAARASVGTRTHARLCGTQGGSARAVIATVGAIRRCAEREFAAVVRIAVAITEAWLTRAVEIACAVGVARHDGATNVRERGAVVVAAPAVSRGVQRNARRSAARFAVGTGTVAGRRVEWRDIEVSVDARVSVRCCIGGCVMAQRTSRRDEGRQHNERGGE